MANQALIKAERAGKDYFRDHPASNHEAAERIARAGYATGLERDLFVAGWNRAFWDEQARVLKASRAIGGSARKSDLAQLAEDEASEREGLRLMGAGE